MTRLILAERSRRLSQSSYAQARGCLVGARTALASGDVIAAIDWLVAADGQRAIARGLRVAASHFSRPARC